jgi:hypothetical protein
MTRDRERRHGSFQPRRTLSYRIVRLGPRWTMRLGLAAFVAQFAVACGGDSSSPAPPPLAAGRSAPTPDSDSKEETTKSDELDPVVVNPTESSPSSSVFAGTLATTATVPFGGGGFCKYDVTLKDVAIEVELLANGDVGRATMRDLAVEKALDGCPYAPMDPSIQDFTLKSQAVTTTGTRIELVGAKTNRPETALVIDLVESGAGYEATGTWKRTDQQGALGWSVTAKISLAKK